MLLIYINEIGEDYKGQKQYEFIFSKSTEIDMSEWFVIPASASRFPRSRAGRECRCRQWTEWNSAASRRA